MLNMLPRFFLFLASFLLFIGIQQTLSCSF